METGSMSVLVHPFLVPQRRWLRILTAGVAALAVAPALTAIPTLAAISTLAATPTLAAIPAATTSLVGAALATAAALAAALTTSRGACSVRARRHAVPNRPPQTGGSEYENNEECYQDNREGVLRGILSRLFVPESFEPCHHGNSFQPPAIHWPFTGASSEQLDVSASQPWDGPAQLAGHAPDLQFFD